MQSAANKSFKDDNYRSATSDLQLDTERILSKQLSSPNDGPPTLQRNAHLQFLVKNLIQGFPARYMSQDASQPWLMYWTLQGFSVLQVGLDPGNRQRTIDTVLTWQHPDGGFGGGPGQAAHLLPTYASVCALAIAGRPGPGGGWDQINREKLYRFFMSLKQPDGSFLVSQHGEVDVRGIYCLLCVATLLDLLTPELVSGTAAFIASCQTYEGGFSSSSHPYFSAEPDNDETLLDSPRPPLGEAHGGYTFCALASWVLLKPTMSTLNLLEAKSAPKIDERALARWLALMQGSEAELGGFKGRSNKLVDGCYSWWVGGAFPLLEAIGIGSHYKPAGPSNETESEPDSAWTDSDDSLMNREALQEYVLLAGQHSAGGLRDKPPKGADAYHTLYCLAGLSSAQHTMSRSAPRNAEIRAAWKSHEDSSTTPSELRKTVFAECLSWLEEEGTSCVVGPSLNKVNATHPLLNLTVTHAEGIMAHFYQQTLPPHPIRLSTKK